MAAVGIYEPSTHENLLSVACRVATAAGHDVTVFTTESIAGAVRPSLDDCTEGITWICRPESERLHSFLDTVEQFCDAEIDLLFVQSLYASTTEIPFYLPFDPDCARLLRIYNVNRWLKATPSLRLGPRRNLHTLFRWTFLRKFDGVTVEYPPMARYVAEKCDYSESVYPFVPTLYEGNQRYTDGPVTVTVPGYIESRRRNYDLVLDAFEELFSHYGDQLSLCLLGSPSGEYGDRILSRCRKLVSGGYDVSYYRNWVSMEEFETALAESNFVLAPLRRSIEGRGIVERYGTTKGSGNVLDAISTGTPLIVPHHFEIADEIETSTLTYDGRGGLVQTLDAVIGDGDRRRALARAARENADQYRLQSQADRFSAITGDLLNPS